MNQVKKKDQNFLPKEAEAILDGIHGIINAFKDEKGLKTGPFAQNAGLLKNSLLTIEKAQHTPKGKRSTIDLWTLVKILNQYPELRIRLGEYLLGLQEEKVEKPTPDTKSEGSAISINEYIKQVSGFNETILIANKTIADQHATINRLTGGEVVEQGEKNTTLAKDKVTTQ